jgi:hypothetical protein
MLRDVKASWVEVERGVFNGDTLIDIYKVGHRPRLNGGTTPYFDKIISHISIKHEYPESPTAFIYYEEGDFQFEENVKRYAVKTSAQGNPPTV